MSSGLVIGVTDCGKWDNYARWVSRFDPQLETVKLSWKGNNLSDVSRCHGLIFSGGEDVHPRFYGEEHRLGELDSKEVNLDRDDFEMAVMKKAVEDKLPVFGICRGLQIINVFFGGSLVLDLPSIGKSGHEKSGGYDQRHSIKVIPQTQLQSIVGTNSGEVNTAHHQAADRIGKGLRISATSDGVVEALEWEDPAGRPFLQLVQWHPERMVDTENPFSKNVIRNFLHAVSIRQKEHQPNIYSNKQVTNV